MVQTSKALRWCLVGLLAVAVAIFGPGVYRGMSDNREDTYQGLKILSDVIGLVEKKYVDEVEAKKLIENAIQGMVSSLDPHSSLLTPEAYRDLQIDTQGEFTGIGIHVTMRDDLVTVISPIEGTPAYRAGIKAADQIVKVDGTPTLDLRDAVRRMRGPKGTEVVITVLREGQSQPIDFKLVRALIPIHSVKSIALESGYGYVWVTHFRENTYVDLVDALEKLENQDTPMQGLILDLRDNPGGILDQAIHISDLFLEKGVIMSSKGRDDRHTRIYKARSTDARPRTYPMVVLINDGSASASEIVAGALQDQKRALIVGTTSFGKGSVQAIESLRDGYALKLTIARYYTPSGRTIQSKGVEPDIVVPYQDIKAQAEKPRQMLKESDLANNLNVEPSQKRKAVAPDGDHSDKDTPSDKPSARLSPLTRDQLLKDNQVRRALDILVTQGSLQKTGND